MAYGDFLASQTGRKVQIWHSFFWVKGTNLEGVPRETIIGGGGGGGGGSVRCNLIYPYLLQHKSEVQS